MLEERIVGFCAVFMWCFDQNMTYYGMLEERIVGFCTVDDWGIHGRAYCLALS